MSFSLRSEQENTSNIFQIESPLFIRDTSLDTGYWILDAEHRASSIKYPVSSNGYLYKAMERKPTQLAMLHHEINDAEWTTGLLLYNDEFSGEPDQAFGKSLSKIKNVDRITGYITDLLESNVAFFRDGKESHSIIVHPSLDFRFPILDLRFENQKSKIQNPYYEANTRILSHLSQSLAHIREQNRRISLEIRQKDERNHQLEEEVANLKNLSRQVIDSIQSYILIVDNDSRIRGYNSAVQRLTGQKALDGKGFSDVMSNTEWMEAALFNVIKTGNIFHAEDADYGSRDGKQSVVDMRIHPCYDQMGEIQGAILIIDDVTEQRMVEKRLMRSEKLASIGRLSANLAHELNNPLDGVLRYVRLLLDQMPADDPRRIYAEQARDGLTRMASMVRGLLDFSRKSTPIFSPIDIPRSIRRTISAFNDQITTQNIKVEVRFDESIPVILNADVEQIFVNIIKNAIQAMPDGGTLSIDARMFPGITGKDACATSSPQVSGSSIQVRFSDTGSGIPEEIHEAVFDPFFTTKDFGQGVGLGLSISREIAESYNGSIEVESKPGKGATFIVKLPISKRGLTAI